VSSRFQELVLASRHKKRGQRGVETVKSALIAGVVAAVVAAASGTAAGIVVTSKMIKNGTIQVVDLSAAAKKALKGNRGARGAAGAPGPAGPQGPQGLQGPPGVQQLRLVVSPTIAVPPNQLREAQAACPAGEIAVSGGYGLQGDAAAVVQSYGLGAAWSVKAENGFDATADAQVAAYAYCAPGVAFLP
jgi:hypothetical protein